jgi:Anti-sigma-K factor rskA
VRVAAVSRSATAADQLQAPTPDVWRAVQSELGLSGDTAGPGVAESAPGVSEGQAVSDGRMQDVRRDKVRELAGEGSDRDSGTSVVSPTAAVDSGRRRGSRARRALSLALAAAIALVVGFGLGFLVDRFVQPTETVVERAQLQALPAWPGARGEAWVERDGTGDRFLEVRVDSSRPDPGYRQVWLIDRNVKAMASMGFLNNGVGRFNIPDDMDLNQFPIVDVSAEPANDANPAHSGDSIVRGQLAS